MLVLCWRWLLMGNLGPMVVGLWAGYCVFVFDWRLGVAWSVVALISAS